MSTGAFAEAGATASTPRTTPVNPVSSAEPATTLALGAMVRAWVDAESALERATDTLDLARGSGMPSAIRQLFTRTRNRVGTQRHGPACQLMHEADNSTSETFINLLFSVFLAGSLSEWYTTLDAARRLFRLDRRSGVTPPGALVIVFNFVTRALADDRPIDTAIVQGIPLGVVGRSFPILASSTAITADVAENRLLASYSQTRSHATLIMADAEIGENTTYAMRTGESMNREQAIEYTSAMLDQYLAENLGTTVGGALRSPSSSSSGGKERPCARGCQGAIRQEGTRVSPQLWLRSPLPRAPGPACELSSPLSRLDRLWHRLPPRLSPGGRGRSPRRRVTSFGDSVLAHCRAAA